MIRVDRARVTKPSALDGPTSKGEREKARNLAILATNPPGKPKFTAYKDSEVVTRLEELFRRKCAYCESQYAGLHPVEVEHFRPKAEVRQDRGAAPEDGYWWLAANWENLYSSCIDCNRARFHEWMVGARKVRAKRGKENLFPLKAPRCARHTPGCENAEVRLLLDPCADDPSLALTWTDRGDVLARPLAGGGVDERGDASIKCYGLDRYDLARLREARAIEVLAAIVRLKQAENRCKQYPGDQTFFDDAVREAATLRRYLREEEPYTGMARELVERHYGPI